jgi:hypothetical protein
MDSATVPRVMLASSVRYKPEMFASAGRRRALQVADAQERPAFPNICSDELR